VTRQAYKILEPPEHKLVAVPELPLLLLLLLLLLLPKLMWTLPVEQQRSSIELHKRRQKRYTMRNRRRRMQWSKQTQTRKYYPSALPLQKMLGDEAISPTSAAAAPDEREMEEDKGR
jgi:hypothetical protein